MRGGQKGLLEASIGVYRRGTEVRPGFWGKQMRVNENMRLERRGTGRKHGLGVGLLEDGMGWGVGVLEDGVGLVSYR
jgi:hypothetical protein